MKGEKAHRHVEGYEVWECAAFLTSGVFLFLAEGFFFRLAPFSVREAGATLGNSRILSGNNRFTSAKLETRPRPRTPGTRGRGSSLQGQFKWSGKENQNNRGLSITLVCELSG